MLFALNRIFVVKTVLSEIKFASRIEYITRVDYGISHWYMFHQGCTLMPIIEVIQSENSQIDGAIQLEIIFIISFSRGFLNI